MEKQAVISNKNVIVSYIYTMDAVTVLCNKTNKQRCFGGWPDLEDLFDAFWSVFSDDHTFDDAVYYFTPNISQKIVE